MKPLHKYGRFFILGLILIGFGFSRPAQATDPTLSLEQYWQKIREAQALVADLKDVPVAAQQTQLTTLADQLAGITHVTLPDGPQMLVDHSFLVTELRTNPPNLARVSGLLAALAAASQERVQGRHDPQDVEIFGSILARPEFQWPEQQLSPLAEWWQNLQQRFWRFIASLLPEEDSLSINGSLIGYGLTGLAIMVLLIVVVLTLRGLLADFVAEADLDSETGGQILTADAAFKRAQGLSGSGDYRTAVRYLYLSSLLLLEERGLLRYDRTQTNREYLRSVAHLLPQLAVILREIIEVFDRVWYGYQPLDEAAYSLYAAQVVKLRQQK